MGFLRSNSQAAESYGQNQKSHSTQFFCLPYLTPFLPLRKIRRNFPCLDETFLYCFTWENVHNFSAICPSLRPYTAAILTVPPEVKGKLCSAIHKTPCTSCPCQWLWQKQQQQQFIPLMVLQSPWKFKWTMAHSTLDQDLAYTRVLTWFTSVSLLLIQCITLCKSFPLPTLKQQPLPLRDFTSYKLNANTTSYHLSWHSPKKW